MHAYIAALLTLAGGAVPASAEPLNASISARVMTVTRATHWTRSAAFTLQFRTFHPQGMVKVGSKFFVSAVEIVRLPKKLDKPQNGNDYDEGAGIGHLFKVGADGKLVADLVLGEGSIYHPGGIDFDGSAIWVPVAEYRPNSRSIIYRVDPKGMTFTIALRVADHIGGIVHDIGGQRLVAVTWGSRRYHFWSIAADGHVAQTPDHVVTNTESYIDYQDCHGLDGRRMVCAGVAEYRPAPQSPVFALGGIDLIDLATLRPIWQTPIALWSPSGRSVTQNPFWIEATSQGLRGWFLPDDDTSTMLVYDTILTPTQMQNSSH